MRTLRHMTPEESAHLRHVVLNDLAKERSPRSTRGEDIMTEEEAQNLRVALFNKIDKIPGLGDSKFAESPVLQAVGGNVDGAAQSVEVVTPEKEVPVGEQASIVQPTGKDEQINVERKLQAQTRVGKL